MQPLQRRASGESEDQVNERTEMLVECGAEERFRRPRCVGFGMVGAKAA
jgi:hypothetical protein